MRLENDGVPHLVVLAPDSDRGRRIPLDEDYMVVGRESTCDVRFDDPHVSRAHAVLEQRGNAVYVQDLGSSRRTFVNGETVTTARKLRVGDVLTFATVTARLESDEGVIDETGAVPASTTFRIDQQNAGVISNVGRDQYKIGGQLGPALGSGSPGPGDPDLDL